MITNFKKLTFAFILSGHCAYADTTIQLHGFSVHDSGNYNSFNYGVGIQHDVSEKWSVSTGAYHNSEYATSSYLYARRTLYKTNKIDAGVSVGVVSGYKFMSIMPVAFPEICYSYVCGIYLPKINSYGSNAIGFFLKIPIE